jgi:FMN-dependent NADH-azoreductase
VLGFIGITEVETVYGEALNMGPDANAKGISAAKSSLAAISA